MAEEKKDSCLNCKYFSDGLSEKGYCKLYHHNITMPERICSRFEKKEEKQTVLQSNECKDCCTKTAQNRTLFNYKDNNRLTYFIGVVCSFILIVTLLLVDIAFAVELHPHKIALPVKIGTLSVVMAFFLFFAWHTLMLLRKYRWMYILYLIVSLVLVLLIFLDFGNVWLTLNSWLNGIIDYVFYELHMG